MRPWAIGFFAGWATGLLIAWALSCDALMGERGPSMPKSAVVCCDGLPVVGHETAEAAPLLEQGWAQAQLRFPGARLYNWYVEMWRDPIPCGGANAGGTILPPDAVCKGITSLGQRHVKVSWASGDVAGVSAWEFCNAIRADGSDRGCGS